MLLHTLLFMPHQSTLDHASRWPQSHVTTASSFTPPSVKAYVAACRREVESQGRTGWPCWGRNKCESLCAQDAHPHRGLFSGRPQHFCQKHVLLPAGKGREARQGTPGHAEGGQCEVLCAQDTHSHTSTPQEDQGGDCASANLCQQDSLSEDLLRRATQRVHP